VPTGSTLSRLVTASAVCAASVIGAVAAAAPASAVSSDASAYLSRLNAERADHGLRPLALRADLNDVAQGWSNHMAAADALSHNPNLATQITNWQTVGENVGEGPSVDSLDTAFWNSPAHRANILDSSYREVGIGTTWAGGILWITIDFRMPMTTSSSSVATTRTTAHHGHRTLHVGSRGRDVKRVQRHVHVHADGVFGPRTKRAVVRFQHRHHLRANGIVGPRTWRALLHG
jgi:peptidoglycan hydrolase-like protein with peptidoglycan-binding domain